MHTFKPATYFARQMPESTFGGVFGAVRPPRPGLWAAGVWDDASVWNDASAWNDSALFGGE